MRIGVGPQPTGLTRGEAPGGGHRPFGCQLVQPVERKDDVPILLKPSAVEIDRDVGAQQIARRDR
jgi:hypothetical protein